MDRNSLLENPYRPGAGHTPPFLAGRTREQERFKRTLREKAPSDNFLVMGLRGFGKTVLLVSMRQMAEHDGWLWVGNDLSESSSLSEERLALRILTDLSNTLTAKFEADISARCKGKTPVDTTAAAEPADRQLHVFDTLKSVYETTPGLPSDKLIAALNRATSIAARARLSGIILAYDEAQCLMDHVQTNEFPMSTLVECIGTIQKQAPLVPILLVLSGLPQVQDALTETRTYTERMFQVLHLDRLTRDETWQAITVPMADLMPPLYASKELLSKAVDLSGGYPYLIQFFGKELVEQLLENGGTLASAAFPTRDTLDRLDAGLFGARWSKTTDKQRDFLGLIARRENKARTEFTAQEIGGLSRDGDLSGAQATQMLNALCERGLIYRTRRGKFAFTVPMSEEMIIRRLTAENVVADSWHGMSAAKAAMTGSSTGKLWRWLGA